VKWREGRPPLVLALLGAAALWLPWVDHKAAALVLTGLDLPEFVRFMGDYRSGVLQVQPLAFAVPIVVAALTGVAYAACSRFSFWGRVVTVAACLWLLTVPFPPLEKPGLLVAAGLLVVGLHVLLTLATVPPATIALACSLATVAAAALPLWQYAVMVPALSRLYGRPVTHGAGVYLEMLVAVGSVALSFVLCRRAVRPSPTAPR